jgi:hypothetical protein
MGSLNAPGSIPIVDKQNASWRNEGGALTTVSGLSVQSGPTSSKISTLNDPQQQNRSAASFGTNADEVKVQYSALCLGVGKKITTSDDASLDGGTVSLNTGKVAPDAGNQPEIALKSVSQKSTYHTGNRLVVRNLNIDVVRNSSDGFTPGP